MGWECLRILARIFTLDLLTLELCYIYFYIVNYLSQTGRKEILGALNMWPQILVDTASSPSSDEDFKNNLGCREVGFLTVPDEKNNTDVMNKA